ncbi:MAG TPA: TssQ family T6SS-associated lipoprotein [Burkholderiales bacterium]|nr:TssQ family T6SS-associated lipoprotein [Burkholderiales bacterium]
MAALLTAGCQSEPFRSIQADFKRAFGRSGGESALSAGVKYYEEGKYADATRQLQSAIKQGLSQSDEVRAHKYLAFINCVSDRVSACRDEFRKALRIDPGMELSPAEAGHPIWGPQFRAVKAGR